MNTTLASLSIYGKFFEGLYGSSEKVEPPSHDTMLPPQFLIDCGGNTAEMMPI